MTDTDPHRTLCTPLGPPHPGSTQHRSSYTILVLLPLAGTCPHHKHDSPCAPGLRSTSLDRSPGMQSYPPHSTSRCCISSSSSGHDRLGTCQKSSPHSSTTQTSSSTDPCRMVSTTMHPHRCIDRQCIWRMLSLKSQSTDPHCKPHSSSRGSLPHYHPHLSPQIPPCIRCTRPTPRH